MQLTMSRTAARRGTDQVLWLVRHGESTWNTLGLAQGHNDQARLTARGIRQAWRVVGQLCDRPSGKNADEAFWCHRTLLGSG